MVGEVLLVVNHYALPCSSCQCNCVSNFLHLLNFPMKKLVMIEAERQPLKLKFSCN